MVRYGASSLPPVVPGISFVVKSWQLIYLARALLLDRTYSVLILGEATIAVDSMSSAAIQRIIREEFCDVTILIGGALASDDCGF